ncbi:phytochrome D [Fistulifera solaris]|uniref:histidine kinase n=1 Tax=Fistulifera solaris TaxID=1519565 RepID=A0A1Z5KDK6_FISSO|nr:phytochrome D [Fistulifera solaris]|eukprot:GAX24374.1 phytochrome D [Fistulifera solaris]
MAFHLDFLGVPSFAVSWDGKIEAWNQKLAALSQLSGTEALQYCLPDILESDEDRRRWKNALGRCLEERSPQKCTVHMNCCSDTSPLTICIANYSSGDATVDFAVCFVEACESTDNSTLAFHRPKENDTLIELADSDYCTIVETSNFATMGIDTNYSIFLWNSKMADISEFSRSEVIGKKIPNTFLKSPHFEESCKKAFAGETTSPCYLELTTKCGSLLHLRLVFTAYMDERNATRGAIVMAEVCIEDAYFNSAVGLRAESIQQIKDAGTILVFGVDRNGLVDEWNTAMANATGFEMNDALNKKFIEAFIPEVKRESIQLVQNETLLGKGTSNYKLDVMTHNGESRHLLVSSAPRLSQNKQVCGVLYIAHDITVVFDQEWAVEAMEIKLKRLIDDANAPVFGIDCDGLINEWNEKTEEITGYKRKEVIGCPLIASFIPSAFQNSMKEVLDNAIQGIGTTNFGIEFRTKSNELRQYILNVTTRRDPGNNIVGAVIIAQDITESVQRDRAVAGMAFELRQIIDTANAPIFGIDVNGKVNEWNRRAQILTGYSKEETFDEPLVDRFIAPSMQKKVREILSSALQGNETSNYELEFVAKDGTSRFLLVNATTRRDPELNVIGVVGVAQDVTEDRKQAAKLREMQYLQATQEAKVETERNMTAYFAHELRNPLGAIDSALAAMPDDLPESALDLVSGMRLCTSFMSSIMNNLLDVRKMEEGKMTLSRQLINLRNVATGVQQMLLSSVKPGVTFNVVYQTNGRSWVMGDEHRIQQVLTNVVTNAIKYTVTGSITLKVTWEGKNVRFEVVDTGPGIPASEQEKLFQRFVQRGGAPGTGLGLAIAKHLVNLIGGSIWFISEPTVRPGTTCVVLMPLEECDSPVTAINIGDIHKMICEPLRFLIIDDIKMNRTMLKRRILKCIAPNSIVEEAATGEEALTICGNSNFDVIIVDQYMEEAGGVMVGTDVCYAMRRMNIEAVMIGCSGNDLDKEFMEAGANFVWKKPMPTNDMIIADLKQALGLNHHP